VCVWLNNWVANYDDLSCWSDYPFIRKESILTKRDIHEFIQIKRQFDCCDIHWGTVIETKPSLFPIFNKRCILVDFEPQVVWHFSKYNPDRIGDWVIVFVSEAVFRGYQIVCSIMSKKESCSVAAVIRVFYWFDG